MTSNSDLVQRVFELQITRWRAGAAVKPTVTSVAAGARLSRSALYRSHRGVVMRIQALNGEARDKRQAQLGSKITLLSGQLKAEKSLSRALAHARCGAGRRVERAHIAVRRRTTAMAAEAVSSREAGARATELSCPAQAIAHAGRGIGTPH